MKNVSLKSNRIARIVRNKKGFTLIELVIVIVIIGILAAIVVPSVSGITLKAKKSADIANARTIALAASAYYAESGLTVSGITFDTLSSFGVGSTVMSKFDSTKNLYLSWTGSAISGPAVYLGTEDATKMIYPTTTAFN